MSYEEKKSVIAGLTRNPLFYIALLPNIRLLFMGLRVKPAMTMQLPTDYLRLNLFFKCYYFANGVLSRRDYSSVELECLPHSCIP